jgi:hypothetical protein
MLQSLSGQQIIKEVRDSMAGQQELGSFLLNLTRCSTVTDADFYAVKEFLSRLSYLRTVKLEMQR